MIHTHPATLTVIGIDPVDTAFRFKTDSFKTAKGLATAASDTILRSDHSFMAAEKLFLADRFRLHDQMEVRRVHIAVSNDS